MARSTHIKKAPEEDSEVVPTYRLQIDLKVDMMRFLTKEAKRIGEKHGGSYHPSDIVRALITAYYEKRAIGLLVDPDD